MRRKRPTEDERKSIIERVHTSGRSLAASYLLENLCSLLTCVPYSSHRLASNELLRLNTTADSAGLLQRRWVDGYPAGTKITLLFWS